jgi:hypothetical protein
MAMLTPTTCPSAPLRRLPSECRLLRARPVAACRAAVLSLCRCPSYARLRLRPAAACALGQCAGLSAAAEPRATEQHPTTCIEAARPHTRLAAAQGQRRRVAQRDLRRGHLPRHGRGQRLRGAGQAARGVLHGAIPLCCFQFAVKVRCARRRTSSVRRTAHRAPPLDTCLSAGRG